MTRLERLPPNPAPVRASEAGARSFGRAWALPIAILALAACEGSTDGPIRIGVVGPTQLIYGESMRAAALMFQDELDAGGGIGGRRLELVIHDDAADPERAIELASQLAGDPWVAAVVGHVTSGAMLNAAPIYADSGLVAVSPTATSPDITRSGEWVFRVCPSDREHGPALARWLAGPLSRRRAAVLYANDPYGRGVLEGFAGEFEAAGGAIIARDPFLSSTTQDSTGVDPYLERAIARNADAIVIAGFADEAATIIRAARRLGFTGPILGGEGLLGVENAGPVTEGVYVSAPFLPDGAGGEAAEWVAAYQERYGAPPDAFAAQTYDALRLVARAIEEVGSDRSAIRDYLASIGTVRPAFEGVSGSIAFDENGDVPDKSVAIGRIQGGRVRSAGGG